ncbi:hypothetical protein PFAG_03398 [Plasmodium falciparum Santa Lucia]|uniref:Uncharacterized protein n=1 Tax=Plasmodium falciparum Santa Lucia TaxID=478859 RepID=W7G315_PLAFA|nr:hypothetical protein PFAG_03398 [Plasmodium falciparum Santa Lucia]
MRSHSTKDPFRENFQKLMKKKKKPEQVRKYEQFRKKKKKKKNIHNITKDFIEPHKMLEKFKSIKKKKCFFILSLNIDKKNEEKLRNSKNKIKFIYENFLEKDDQIIVKPSNKFLDTCNHGQIKPCSLKKCYNKDDIKVNFLNDMETELKLNVLHKNVKYNENIENKKRIEGTEIEMLKNMSYKENNISTSIRKKENGYGSTNETSENFLIKNHYMRQNKNVYIKWIREKKEDDSFEKINYMKSNNFALNNNKIKINFDKTKVKFVHLKCPTKKLVKTHNHKNIKEHIYLKDIFDLKNQKTKNILTNFIRRENKNEDIKENEPNNFNKTNLNNTIKRKIIFSNIYKNYLINKYKSSNEFLKTNRFNSKGFIMNQFLNINSFTDNNTNADHTNFEINENTNNIKDVKNVRNINTCNNNSNSNNNIRDMIKKKNLYHQNEYNRNVIDTNICDRKKIRTTYLNFLPKEKKGYLNSFLHDIYRLDRTFKLRKKNKILGKDRIVKLFVDNDNVYIKDFKIYQNEERYKNVLSNVKDIEIMKRDILSLPENPLHLYELENYKCKINTSIIYIPALKIENEDMNLFKYKNTWYELFFYNNQNNKDTLYNYQIIRLNFELMVSKIKDIVIIDKNTQHFNYPYIYNAYLVPPIDVYQLDNSLRIQKITSDNAFINNGSWTFFQKKKKRNSYDINMRRNKYYIDNCSTIKAVKKNFHLHLKNDIDSSFLKLKENQNKNQYQYQNKNKNDLNNNNNNNTCNHNTNTLTIDKQNNDTYMNLFQNKKQNFFNLYNNTINKSNELYKNKVSIKLLPNYIFESNIHKKNSQEIIDNKNDVSIFYKQNKNISFYDDIIYDCSCIYMTFSNSKLEPVYPYISNNLFFLFEYYYNYLVNMIKNVKLNKIKYKSILPKGKYLSCSNKNIETNKNIVYNNKGKMIKNVKQSTENKFMYLKRNRALANIMYKHKFIQNVSYAARNKSSFLKIPRKTQIHNFKIRNFLNFKLYNSIFDTIREKNRSKIKKELSKEEVQVPIFLWVIFGGKDMKSMDSLNIVYKVLRYATEIPPDEYQKYIRNLKKVQINKSTNGTLQKDFSINNMFRNVKQEKERTKYKYEHNDLTRRDVINKHITNQNVTHHTSQKFHNLPKNIFYDTNLYNTSTEIYKRILKYYDNYKEKYKEYGPHNYHEFLEYYKNIRKNNYYDNMYVHTPNIKKNVQNMNTFERFDQEKNNKKCLKKYGRCVKFAQMHSNNKNNCVDNTLKRNESPRFIDKEKSSSEEMLDKIEHHLKEKNEEISEKLSEEISEGKKDGAMEDTCDKTHEETNNETDDGINKKTYNKIYNETYDETYDIPSAQKNRGDSEWYDLYMEPSDNENSDVNTDDELYNFISYHMQGRNPSFEKKKKKNNNNWNKEKLNYTDIYGPVIYKKKKKNQNAEYAFLLLDYPAYNNSIGHPSPLTFKTSAMSALKVAIKEIKEKNKNNNSISINIFGYSLGCSVTLQLVLDIAKSLYNDFFEDIKKVCYEGKEIEPIKEIKNEGNLYIKLNNNNNNNNEKINEYVYDEKKILTFQDILGDQINCSSSSIMKEYILNRKRYNNEKNINEQDKKGDDFCDNILCPIKDNNDSDMNMITKENTFDIYTNFDNVKEKNYNIEKKITINELLNKVRERKKRKEEILKEYLKITVDKVVLVAPFTNTQQLVKSVVNNSVLFLLSSFIMNKKCSYVHWDNMIVLKEFFKIINDFKKNKYLNDIFYNLQIDFIHGQKDTLVNYEMSMKLYNLTNKLIFKYSINNIKTFLHIFKDDCHSSVFNSEAENKILQIMFRPLKLHPFSTINIHKIHYNLYKDIYLLKTTYLRFIASASSKILNS